MSVDPRLTPAGIALIGLGSNLPWRGLAGAALIDAALAALEGQGLRVLARSSIHATTAWPDPTDPPFANAVAQLAVGALAPHAVLARLQGVELAFGRARGRPNAPRTLDLDLLDQGGQVLETPDLVLPHPRMTARRFALAPLAEIAPAWVDPRTLRQISDLLKDLPD